MKNEKISNRDLKGKVFELLQIKEMDDLFRELLQYPPVKLVNVLLSFLYHEDSAVKWHSVTLLGRTVKIIADQDPERARIILRRLMWNLNDESGGIGWGSPEAMGEILACHKILADEFSNILISYTRPEWNYLEDERLQGGLLWGIGRFSEVRPEYFSGFTRYIYPYLESGLPQVRGHAAWVLGLLGAVNALNGLEGLQNDSSEMETYRDCKVIKMRVEELAKEAIAKIS